jgi:hypothetical protein
MTAERILRLILILFANKVSSDNTTETTMDRSPTTRSLPPAMIGHEQLRELVSKEFRLGRLYAEKEAAKFIKVGISTPKRKRRSKLVPFVDRGDGSVGYLGVHLADIVILGASAINQLTLSSTD